MLFYYLNNSNKRKKVIDMLQEPPYSNTLIHQTLTGTTKMLSDLVNFPPLPLPYWHNSDPKILAKLLFEIISNSKKTNVFFMKSIIAVKLFNYTYNSFSFEVRDFVKFIIPIYGV